MEREITKELLAFIQKSPSCYHVVANISKILEEEGYQKLLEGERWKLQPGGKYYVIRNASSIIAFRIPKFNYVGFMIAASHSDAPAFKIKSNPEMRLDNQYTKLNVEKYGGMICSTWLDRPLSIAGKVMVSTEEGIEERLFNVDRDLLMIPNLAIHMNREINDGYKFNAQRDMLPLFGGAETKETFNSFIAKNLQVEEEQILGMDLFLYNRMQGCLWGENNEFFSSGKIDDLECAFTSLKGFLKGNHPDTVQVLAVFDNEEVGSGTKQGAKSTFLFDTLSRINRSAGRDEEAYHMALASSFMLSADNGHGVHPNLPEKADPTNHPYMNQGVVIKYNANQKYTTDSVSEAIFKKICMSANVPYQVYVNRSDILGGSTLGNLANERVSVNTVDIGLAQLAMHSAYETAGTKDVLYMARVMEAFYQTCLKATDVGAYQIRL